MQLFKILEIHETKVDGKVEEHEIILHPQEFPTNEQAIIEKNIMRTQKPKRARKEERVFGRNHKMVTVEEESIYKIISPSESGEYRIAINYGDIVDSSFE